MRSYPCQSRARVDCTTAKRTHAPDDGAYPGFMGLAARLRCRGHQASRRSLVPTSANAAMLFIEITDTTCRVAHGGVGSHAEVRAAHRRDSLR